MLKILEQGLQENPVTTTAAQMAGAFASPVKFGEYSKTAPISVKNAINARNAVANGVAYGIGSGQDNWQNYIGHTMAGLSGNLVGNKFVSQALGRSAAPAVWNVFWYHRNSGSRN